MHEESIENRGKYSNKHIEHELNIFTSALPPTPSLSLSLQMAEMYCQDRQRDLSRRNIVKFLSVSITK